MEIKIRKLAPTDFDAVIALQRRVYPTIPSWTQEQLENHLRIFPQGQFVAEMNGRVIGAASSLVILWDDYGLNHTWLGVTGNGYFDTHDRAGKTLYGAEVCVDPKARSRGVGHRIYQARRRLCRELNLKRIIAGGRLPGYAQHADKMTPELYAMKVVWGDLFDPVLRFQLSKGFHFCGVMPGYLPTDADSCGNAALIVWLNPRYNPKKPTGLEKEATS